MAVTTYSELATAIGQWAHRGDIAGQVDNFIAMVESDLRVRCRLVEFEGSASVPVASGVGTLPTGLQEIRSIVWDADPARVIRYVTPAQFDAIEAAQSGQASVYTITGSDIKTAPSGDGTLTLTYKATFTPLSASDPQNALLASYPDVYLYGCVAQAGLFLVDDGMVQRFGPQYEAAVQRIRRADAQKRHTGPLAVRPA